VEIKKHILITATVLLCAQLAFFLTIVHFMLVVSENHAIMLLLIWPIIKYSEWNLNKLMLSLKKNGEKT